MNTSSPEIVLSSHATQMLLSRSISKSDLMTALSSGTSRTDDRTGNEVIADGDLRIVVKRDRDQVLVVTVMRAADLSE